MGTSMGIRSIAVQPANMRGFSLIELMIAVLIIGILASIAYPSYTESARKGKRAEARTVLLEAAQFMQRYYAANDTFAGAELPASLSESGFYTISVADGATRTTYSLQAVPKASLSEDKCGTLTLNNAGQRGTTGEASVNDCWK